MTGTRTLAAAAAALLVGVTVAQAEDNIRIYTSADPMMKLGNVSFEGGRTIELTVGIGSGAFRHPSLPANVFQTVSDRGPNFTCKDGAPLTGLSAKQLCGGSETGRVYPVPDYAPSIYTVELLANSTFRILDVIAIKDAGGKPLTGITNPLKKAKTEIPHDARGRKLAQDPRSLDMEGFVRLNDGSFWVGEENAPSIAHIAPDGRVIKRLVPAGTEGDFAGANYTVEGKLPAILYRRHTNRGIESLAVSPDERFLYFSMQSPLANPDTKAYAASANVRVFKFDRAREEVVGEFLYVMDKPDTFIKDNVEKKRKQSDVKISELMATGPDRLIVLERIAKTTKLYEIDLAGATNILGTRWGDPENKESLELKADGVTPVQKVLKFNTDDHKGFPEKIEALAQMGDGTTMLLNDDDFGIEGARTVIATVKELKAAQPKAKQAAAK